MISKTFLRAALPLIFLTAAVSCSTKKSPAVADNKKPFELDVETIANKLVERMDLQPNESVVLVGKPGNFDALVPLLKERIEAKGAAYLGTFSVDSIQPQAWLTEFTGEASDMSIKELTKYLNSVDLGVMLPGASPSDSVYAAMQDVLKSGQGRTIHFHWAGAYTPTGKLIEPDTQISRFYQNVLLKTDYDQLSKRQKQFEDEMRNQWMTVTTPEGTNLKFQIGNRPVTKQDGDASFKRSTLGLNLIDREVELPAGAIRVAPIEESVEGTIAFPDGVWSDQSVKGLVMTFKKGKLSDVKASEGLEAVKKEIADAGDAGKSFREFALGFNPLLAIPTEGERWIPYYGYGSGVVRLSLGDNSELGGKVTGGYVRWNFFINATVKVGEKLWVSNGQLVADAAK